MSKEFILTKDELFGSYCYIEQKGYGVPNEKFLYKIIGNFTSNAWSNVPVDANDKEPHLFNHSEEVVDVVCCVVCEDKIERYKLSDVEIISNKNQQIANLKAKLAESEDCNNMLNKCLTEKDIEIETQKEENAELQKQLHDLPKKIEEIINNYPIKLKIKPYIFTAEYERWSIRQTEDKHKYLILVEEEGKIKPAGSYSTKSKRLLMYNVKYTPPLTILEKIVTSCEIFEKM